MVGNYNDHHLSHIIQLLVWIFFRQRFPTHVLLSNVGYSRGYTVESLSNVELSIDQKLSTLPGTIGNLEALDHSVGG